VGAAFVPASMVDGLVTMVVCRPRYPHTCILVDVNFKVDWDLLLQSQTKLCIDASYLTPMELWNSRYPTAICCD
jgi:hypothetical protein